MSKERPLRGEELDRIEQGSFSGLVIANREGAPPLTLFIFAQMFRRLQQKIVNVRREESQRREDMFEAVEPSDCLGSRLHRRSTFNALSLWPSHVGSRSLGRWWHAYLLSGTLQSRGMQMSSM